MVERILQLLSVSCWHRHMSQPFSAQSFMERRAVGQDWEPVVARGPSHYVVCLDCGRKFSYDWNEMRVMR